MSSSQSTKRKRKPKTSTDKKLCDVLAKRIVIHRAEEWTAGMCERCGIRPGEHWAHIIGRARSRVRTHEDNAWWLCAEPCHRLVDNWIEEKLALVDRTIGRERYEELRFLAEQPISNYTTWWRDERGRLTARCEALGISTKFRTSA